MAQTKVALVGVGAIGGGVIADLADLGRVDIQLCSRTPFEALEVTHPEGRSRVDVAVATDPANAYPADWVLLATKAHESESAKPWLDALGRAGTIVAVLQNGVDHEARIGPLLKPGVDVLPVVVQLPSEKQAPGRIHQTQSGTLIVPQGKAGRAFSSLFEGGRTNIAVHDDFETQAWWKLLVNASLGGVCALAQRENGVANEPEVRTLILALMREVLAVGRADGAKLPDDAPEKALDMVLAAAPNHWSSITVDRREGRRLEWRVRNAVVGERGRKHGIPTPLNDVVTTLLRATDEKR